MKRQWRVSRQAIEQPDALRRWDQAYQCLLRWAKAQEKSQESSGAIHPLLRQEDYDEREHKRGR